MGMAEEANSGSRTASQKSDDADGSAREDTERDAQDTGRDPQDSERDEQSSDDGGDGGRDRPEQQVSAPSLGPNTVIEREPVEERLARHDQSPNDAMGLDKRRSVVGESFGPSKTRQFVVYVGFLAILAALVVGGFILVGALDTSVGKNVPNSAPWSKPDAKQIQPKPIQ
jgi:hypothetical protein